MTDVAPIRLVVNADGFGTTPAHNHGILKAAREGIVTSTSLLGNCADPAAVQAQLALAPHLGVGVHLTLLEGHPIAPANVIRSLLGPDERFAAHPREVFLAWATGVMKPDEVEREFDAQVARFRDVGVVIDHLDTRAHIGFLPTVGRAVENVARRHGIAGIRMAVERPTLSWLAEIPRAMSTTLLGGLAWLTRRQIGALRHGPQTWGYVESGNLDQVRILEIIGRLGAGTHELICHPMENPHAPAPPSSLAARELAALTSPLVRQALARRGIDLCRWADLF